MLNSSKPPISPPPSGTGSGRPIITAAKAMGCGLLVPGVETAVTQFSMLLVRDRDLCSRRASSSATRAESYRREKDKQSDARNSRAVERSWSWQIVRARDLNVDLVARAATAS